MGQVLISRQLRDWRRRTVLYGLIMKGKENVIILLSKEVDYTL
jgi:hypothetical protein